MEIEDGLGCVQFQQVMVGSVCDQLSLSTPFVNVSCFGGNDGAIDITMNGGTAPYSFAWSHGPTSEDVISLSSGDYSVTVTDDDGCEIDSTFSVSEPLILNANVSSTNITCVGGNDGEITI